MKRTLFVALALLCSTLYAGAKPKWITYEKYGAKGDGVTDDLAAIVAAHEAANAKGLPVKAKDGATYYIGGAKMSAIIRTDTDFGKASFIIDDTNLESIKSPVFIVESDKSPIKTKCRNVPRKGDSSIDIKLPCRCLVSLSDNSRKVYIRKGLNRNNGTGMTEVLLVEPDGSIDTDAGIVWDYSQPPIATAFPIDEKTLTVSGGTFTTIANQWDSEYQYHDRGIRVNRSNVRLVGITHLVTGELDLGAPYTGFLNIRNAAFVSVENCILTGHKTYVTIGRANQPVNMGSYDLSINNSIYVTMKNCSQTSNLDDKTYWGLMGTNFCKNLVMENCSVSRFDAHQGVRNCTLKNCTFGHMGVRMVGWGTILLENCTVRNNSLISLRQDYGSTWDGEIIVRNCTLVAMSKKGGPYILSGSNNGKHDFGYLCTLPSRIEIDGLTIDDSIYEGEADYKGPMIFSGFNYNTEEEGLLPYPAKGDVILKNISVRSGKEFELSPNPKLFEGYRIIRD